ncbi:MAG: glycosyltransferase family 4 protein, partial [Candidatus Heimdallarchaeota archaeon]|nr:glycosyltransferase family 4 protein [Candidatus Heimdallarchaeota archaeon]
MNTAIIGPYFSSSGTTRHVRNIFRGLSAIESDTVLLITFRETNETLSSDVSNEDRVFVFDKIPLPENFDEFSDFITEIVVKYKIRVLQPQIKPFILLCSALAKHKLKAINHDIIIVGTWHSNFSWIQQAPYHLAMANIGIQHCDGIIPVSEDVTSSVKQYLGYPSSQISAVIPPGGIDFEYVNKPRPELLVELKRKFSIDEKYIIFLGRLLYNKGIDTLIKSFKYISADFRLIIIGKGPFEGELIKLINKLELGSKIIFSDFITDDKVYA